MTTPTSDSFLSDEDWTKQLNAERCLHPYTKPGEDRWGYLEACEQNDNPQPILDLNRGCDTYVIRFDSVTSYPTISAGDDDSDARRQRFKLRASNGKWKFSYHKLWYGLHENLSLRDQDTVKLGGHKFTFHDTITPEVDHEGAFTKYSVVPGSQVRRGSYGEVYQAVRQGEPAAIYAIKVIIPPQDDDKALPTYEISCMKALEHPNICQLEEVFSTDNGNLHLIMKYALTGTLDDWLKPAVWHSQASPLSLNVFSGNIMFQICSAIQYIHEKGIIHRDIKPGNVLIASRRPLILKVADFGFATRDLTPTQKGCGTEVYMAPEIVRTGRNNNSKYNNKVDVYSVGALLLDMVVLQNGHPITFLHDAAYRLLSNNSDMRFEHILAQVRLSRIFHLTQANPKALELVRSLLCINPGERLSMKDALAHPWLREMKPEVVPAKVKRPSFPTEDFQQDGLEAKADPTPHAISRPAKRAKLEYS